MTEKTLGVAFIGLADQPSLSFVGIADRLDREHITWGIVSNKIERYVRLLVKALQLDTRSSCLVGGDTTPTPKPHPAPLLLGAKLSKFEPAKCIYVGDDLRDVQAGKAAGMYTVAAAYGYNGADDPAEQWNAEYTIQKALDLLPILGLIN